LGFQLGTYSVKFTFDQLNGTLMLFAYIDVVLGSMLLQGMAGMILAGIVMGRRVLAAPLGWFQSKEAVAESQGELQEVSANP
jgi:hypothetical protein